MHPFRVHKYGNGIHQRSHLRRSEVTPDAGAFCWCYASWSKALFGAAFTQIHDAFLAIRLCTLEVADKLDNVPGLVN
jgi:hypothetical protein